MLTAAGSIAACSRWLASATRMRHSLPCPPGPSPNGWNGRSGEMTDFVATSIARRLIVRMQATHDRRRISVFSGPPGIGKTTAIDRFAATNAGSVAVVKVARRNAREVLVLQHA